jgi:pimeloyl-ACP methyl ester carboxylesterase
MTGGTTGPEYVTLRDGRRLAFEEYGDPQGVPMFFFHGWIGSRLDFAPNDEGASNMGVRVLSVDRPGCGESDFQPNRKLLDWPGDIANAADELGLDRFAVCGHSFGGPYVAACALELKDRLTSATIVAGISPTKIPKVTKGMPGLVRMALWLGGRAPTFVRPYVSLMAATTKNPSLLKKGFEGMLPESELALFETAPFEGFLDHSAEMVKHGSKGAYWDARVVLAEWGFDCGEIEMPVSLFYGTEDRNVPVAMGRYYDEAIPDTSSTFYEGEGHFIMYTRAAEILGPIVKVFGEGHG